MRRRWSGTRSETGFGVLEPEDVAASVAWALTRTDPVAVNEVLVEPRDEPA